MKFIFYSLFVMGLSMVAQGASSSEDEIFPQTGNNTYEEDDMDRAFQQDQQVMTPAKQDKTDTTVKIEINQAEPQSLSEEEVMTPAQKLALENQRRQKAILSELSGSGGLVKNCITRNNKEFRGTYITLQWVVSPMGKIQKASIKSTDIGDLAIRDCIKRASARFDFSDAVGGNLKPSTVVYTYKFNGKAPKGNLQSSNLDP
jgi:hypothetical protein